MTNSYFSGGPEQIKAQYRRLAMQHHPDRGGNTETMKQINALYQSALKAVDGSTSNGSDGQEHVYRYNNVEETAIADKVQELCGISMIGVEIMLIGKWIWITGETKQYSKLLGKNGAGMWWHRKRAAWYWHLPQKRRTRYNSKASLEGIAATYGYTDFESDKRKAIA